MVTQFNKKDLKEFGDFIISNLIEKGVQKDTSVHSSDIEKWMSKKTKDNQFYIGGYLFEVHENSKGELEQVLLNQGHNNWYVVYAKENEKLMLARVNSMCMESLEPETFSAWEKVRNTLMNTRSDLK